MLKKWRKDKKGLTYHEYQSDVIAVQWKCMTQIQRQCYSDMAIEFVEKQRIANEGIIVPDPDPAKPTVLIPEYPMSPASKSQPSSLAELDSISSSTDEESFDEEKQPYSVTIPIQDQNKNSYAFEGESPIFESYVQESLNIFGMDSPVPELFPDTTGNGGFNIQWKEIDDLFDGPMVSARKLSSFMNK